MKRNALTLVELLVVIAILGILFFLLTPAIRTTRHRAARRAICQNNLRQIALAAINYESAHQCFPSCIGIAGFSGVGSSDQLGPFVEILPFMDETERYDRISKGYTLGNEVFPPFPALNAGQYEPWRNTLPMLLCSKVPEVPTTFAKTHYGFCIGDRARNIHAPETARGAFSGRMRMSSKDIGDGTSNTIMAAEIGARTYAARENRYAINQSSMILESPVECYELVDGDTEDWQFAKGISLSSISRGGHWADGRAGVALFNTILPPNSPSAAVKGSVGVDGIYSASGPHPGTINVSFFDGSTHSINLEIDAGNSSLPTPKAEEMASKNPTRYGVWGALGTINGGEVVNEF